MQGHIIVQRGVDGPGPQAVGHRQHQQHPELVGEGEPQQRRGGEEHAAHCHHRGAQLLRQPVGAQAGHHRPGGDDHGHNAHVGHRHLQVPVHHRPPGPQQGVRQPQADKRDVDQNKQ